jgi:TATA-binding protein-associated factor
LESIGIHTSRYAYAYACLAYKKTVADSQCDGAVVSNSALYFLNNYRLDRLFILLETGSTPSTRRAAASQLGAVQKLHPHELPHLLQRVHKCLRSPSWETRIAGGQAVEAILSEVPLWEPSEPESPIDMKFVPGTSTTELLCFSTFSVSETLSSGTNQLLMGSEGSVFDRESEQNPQNQRALINQKLGLDIAAKIGIDTSDMFSNEDLDGGESSLSSREVNLAKRRARKQKSREAEGCENSKKLKVEDSVDLGFGEEDYYDKCLAEGRWPLERWVDILLTDLFSPTWEVRRKSLLYFLLNRRQKTKCLSTQ